MSERKKRSQRDYSLAFKLEVVSAVEKGEITYKQAQKKYGIQGKTTVLVWLRKHGQQDWSVLAQSLQRKQSQAIYQTTAQPPTPEQRIKALETELESAKMQSLLLKTMLDVMVKEHGVTLAKKPSPGPLTSCGKKKG